MKILLVAMAIFFLGNVNKADADVCDEALAHYNKVREENSRAMDSISDEKKKVNFSNLSHPMEWERLTCKYNTQDYLFDAINAQNLTTVEKLCKKDRYTILCNSKCQRKKLADQLKQRDEWCGRYERELKECEVVPNCLARLNRFRKEGPFPFNSGQK